MFSLSSRLVQAQEVSNPVKHFDTEKQKAGRESEKAFVELLKKHGVAYACDIFQNLRIPDSFQTQKHEIDVVFLTGEAVNVIEIKNHGGELSCSKDGEYWDQRKHSKNNYLQLSHSNPVSLVDKKANLLRTYLMKAGICLREKNFISKVINMNEKCKYDESISTNPSVVTYSQLDEYFNNFAQTITSQITSPLIPYFFTGSLSYSQINQCRNALNQIGTWDIIELNGGRLLVGDYKGCKELNISRTDIEKIEFSHQRNATVSTFWAVLGYEPTTTVSMHKRNSTGWFGPTISATVSVPFNRDIEFQIAGEKSFSKIPVNEIKAVILSK